MHLVEKNLSGQMAYKITIQRYQEFAWEFGPYLNTENIESRKWADNFFKSNWPDIFSLPIHADRQCVDRMLGAPSHSFDLSTWRER